MTLPNFFIVGAAKSGTTTLYHFLAQHPDVFMPKLKEPHYFVKWGKHVKSLEEYQALFSGWSGEKAVGEASTSYLYEEETPGTIKVLIPEAKIIIILRNPVEMAFSLWRHMTRLGKRGEWLSFERALAAEQGRLSDPGFRAGRFGIWYANFCYASRAMYHDQVKRYIDTFGPERVLVLIFEEFRKKPAAVCKEAYRFLGVDDSFTPLIKAHNVGREVRHRGLDKLLKRPEGLSARVTGLIPPGTKDFLNRLNTKPAPLMDKRTSEELAAKFVRDVKMLEKLLGRDLSLWH